MFLKPVTWYLGCLKTIKQLWDFFMFLSPLSAWPRTGGTPRATLMITYLWLLECSHLTLLVWVLCMILPLDNVV